MLLALVLSALQPASSAVGAAWWQIESGSTHCEISADGLCITDGQGLAPPKPLGSLVGAASLV
jgi:hypothetical protein